MQTEDKSEKQVQQQLPPSVFQLTLPFYYAPLIHQSAFADYNGLSLNVVGAWVDKGYLPVVKIGKYTFINLVLLTENLKLGRVL